MPRRPAPLALLLALALALTTTPAARAQTRAAGANAATARRPTPAPAPAPVQRTRSVTIAGTGDVLVHRRVESVARARQSDGGFRWMLAAMTERMPESDVAFVNLESPLSEAFHPPANADPPVLGAPTSYGRDLAAAGFDVVSLANNHAYDQAGDGLAITLDAVRDAGMLAAGAGRGEEEALRPAVVTRDGVRVAFIAATERINNGPAPNRAGMRIFQYGSPAGMEAAIGAARRAADVVVVSIHWSHDFVLAPTPAQRRLAQQWVDWGADVILGTGPHLLQRVERLRSPRGDAVVAYSLGNAISNQGYRHRVGAAVTAATVRSAIDNPMTRDVVLLRIGAELDHGRVRLARIEARAFWNENRAGADDLRLVRLRDVPEPLRAERGRALRAALGPEVTVDE